MGTQLAIDRVKPEAQLGPIVEAARAGDQEAFTRLVTALWPTLIAFARTVLGYQRDAEDVVQEALLVAWQKLPELRSANAFRTWMWRIIYTKGIELLRRTPQLDPLDAALHEPIHLVTKDIDLERALEALTPQQRAVVHLLYVEGRTCAEVGAALGITSITVRIHKLQAVDRLRRRYHVELP